MGTYDLKMARLPENATSDAASNPLHAFRARRRDSISTSCQVSDQNRARRRTEELQRAAFQEMFEASRPRLLALAHHILRNKEDAEDALHDAFLSGYRNVRNFEGRSALSTWFTRIVLNAALMIRRKRSPSRIRFLEDSPLHDSNWIDRISCSRADPEMVHGERETLRIIQERLGNMNPLLGQAFRMIHFEELSVQESCARLGVPKSTFKARLFRARRQLSTRVRRVQVAPIRRANLSARSAGPGHLEVTRF